MTVDIRNECVYPSVSDISDIHDDIIREDNNADGGVINIGSVDFSLSYIKHGYYGEYPESIHQKATHLMRLLSANHSFVDGNKRTALNTTWVFYFINGYYFDYGEEIKAILKLYAVMENMVDTTEVCEYFQEIAIPIEESDAVAGDVQELFKMHRQIAERIEEAEYMISDIDQEENVDDAINLINKTIDDLRSVVELIENSSDDETDLFRDILDDQVEELDSLVDDLTETYKSG